MKNNQNGFGAVEALVIVVILGLVAFGGWYMWHKNSTKNTDKNVSAQQSKNTDDKDKNKSQEKYLEIKEWGIKIPLSDNLANSTYTLSDDIKTATPSTPIANDTAGECANQVVITKVTDIEAFAAENGGDAETLKSRFAYVNGAYYIVIGGQAACTQDESLQAAASAVRAAWVSQTKKALPLE